MADYDHHHPEGCRGCPLDKTGRGFVLGVGDPYTAQYMICLETPENPAIQFSIAPNQKGFLFQTQEECDREILIRKRDYPNLKNGHIRHGVPAVGPTGLALDSWILKKVGIDRRGRATFHLYCKECLHPVYDTKLQALQKRISSSNGEQWEGSTDSFEREKILLDALRSWTRSQPKMHNLQTGISSSTSAKGTCTKTTNVQRGVSENLAYQKNTGESVLLEKTSRNTEKAGGWNNESVSDDWQIQIPSCIASSERSSNISSIQIGSAICTGASSSDGETTQKEIGALGACASSERDQDRQSISKSNDCSKQIPSGPNSVSLLPEQLPSSLICECGSREFILNGKFEGVFIDHVLRCLPPKGKTGVAYPTGEVKKAAEQHCRQYDRIGKYNPDTVVFGLFPGGLLREITPLPLAIKDFEKVRDFTSQGRRVVTLLGGKAAHAFMRYGANSTKWRGHYAALPEDWSETYKQAFVYQGKQRKSKKIVVRPIELTEDCRSCKRYKGKNVPKNACRACWDKYASSLSNL